MLDTRPDVMGWLATIERDGSVLNNLDDGVMLQKLLHETRTIFASY